MNTFYDPAKKQWLNATALRLPRHDLFFGTPENRPTAGIPIGDGDTGSLLWLEKDGVHIHVNKCDLWQDAPPGVTYNDECYCSGHEEELTCLKHAGEITLKLDSPAFEYLYQTKFTARLSLAEAAALLQSETPFGAVHARAFAHGGVTVLSCDISSAEGEAPEVRLSRWGSRSLWRWYCQQKFTPETCLDGTGSFADADTLYITQELDPTKFCIALRAVSSAQGRASLPNTHTAAFTLPRAGNHRLTLYWTVKTGQTAETAKAACKRALDGAAAIGEEALFAAHRAEWAAFWEKSCLTLPDDYLENIWYLYLYYMNSESRGAYPPHFTSGLWGFYHDYIPWNYYFHYNEQHMYLPLDAAGHGELATCYFDLRKNGVEKNRAFARIVKKTRGAFLHDVTDRFGRGAEYDLLNATPGAQVAMQMWRHWRFTGDEAFLHGIALPFMREVVLFYLDMFQKEADGVYHIHGTTAYEGNAPTDDTLTDVVTARMLFAAFLPYAEDLAPAVRDVLSHLPQDLILPLETPWDWDGETFSYGLGKGLRPVGEGKVFGIGWRDGAPVRKSYGDPDCPKRGYGFPDIEFVSLYPAGETGLKDRGTPIFDVLTNQTLLHGRGEEVGHWNLLPIYLARMGMGKELTEAARAMLAAYQGFPNGFNAESGEVGTLQRDAPAFYSVTNTLTGEKHLLRSDEFVHFDFETEPIIAMALQESLLQSHEGCLRLCPAAGAYPVAFRLFAEGGFAVGAEVTETGYVLTVESARGEPCYIALPAFAQSLPMFAYIAPAGGQFRAAEIKKTVPGNETVLDFSSLKAGETLLLSSAPIESLIPAAPQREVPNAGMKQCGAAVLGSPALMHE